jgi:glycosyltransferase involved in cell wall biosynthesis
MTVLRNPARAAALVIPALNEEEALPATLARVPPSLFRLVLVVDNGSTDRTAEVARAAGAQVVVEPERGYGAACLRALAVLPEEIDAVVFLQADGSEDPAEAAALLAPIYEERADLVIGSRTLGRAEPGALAPHQAFGNRLATGLIRLLYGRRYTDLGPYRAIRRSSLERLGMRDRTYGWTVEMQIRALQQGLRVLEVPVTYRPRVAGEGKVSASLAASFRAGLKIIWTVLRLARRKSAALR